jgi:hypothetical protein
MSQRKTTIRKISTQKNGLARRNIRGQAQRIEADPI